MSSVYDGGIAKEFEMSVVDGGFHKAVQNGWVRDADVWKEFYSAGAAPFLLSGSWEEGLESWVPSGAAARANTSGRARTGTWYVVGGASAVQSGSLTYTIPAAQAAGLVIHASVWRRSFGGSVTARLTVQEAGGDPQTVGGSTSSTTYTLLEASVAASGAADITVTLNLVNSLSGAAGADDWVIEGKQA